MEQPHSSTAIQCSFSLSSMKPSTQIHDSSGDRVVCEGEGSLHDGCGVVKNGAYISFSPHVAGN